MKPRAAGVLLACGVCLCSLSAQGVTSRAIALPPDFPNGDAVVSVACRDRVTGAFTPDRWRAVPLDAPVAVAERGARCRVLVRPIGRGAYVATPEVVWEHGIDPLRAGPRWLRTVHAPAVAFDVSWVGVTDDHVQCRASSVDAQCMFVPAEIAGVMIAQANGSVWYALAAPATQHVVWQRAPAGRLVRAGVQGGAAVTAAITSLRPAIRAGSGQLLDRRTSSAARIHRVGPSSFWVEGEFGDDVELELRSPGASRVVLPLLSVLRSPSVPLDVPMAREETIDGDVRSRGLLLEGATVALSLLLPALDTKPVKDAHRRRERLAETVTDGAGRFRFDGLSPGQYEVYAVHPQRGRVRAVLTPTAFPRLVLEPARIARGRVTRHGIPVQGALVSALPALETVMAAPNPLALAVETMPTAADGRFEILLPEEGRVALLISSGPASQRFDLGDIEALPAVTEVGDIKLAAPIDVEILLELPDGCALQAAGPFGETGVSVIRAAVLSPGRWRLPLPMAGRWIVAGTCAGMEVALDPPVLDIREAGPASQKPVVLRVRR
ncbi:MAG: carboxypeptidase-like regulatory domain-containing protein [Acidobacteriota bacterium]|nr:carboxypeptidase-like regulatory domain-containing protein [Acidobacteriota bacterium]